MEKPKTIFVNFQDSHFIGHMGFWKTAADTGSVSYIREDIAVKAMELLMEQSFCTTLTKEDILQSFSEAFQNKNPQWKTQK